jgi:hypothetical protein
MNAAAHQLAVHIRALDDDHLNDLLVELPPARFAGLLDGAFAAPEVGVPVRYQAARPRPGEASRWIVEAHRLEHRPGMRAPVPAWTVLGAVIQERPAGPRGGTPVAWHARSNRGEPVGDPSGRGWPTRIRATAALLWHCPASGARCAALAAHVRALGDDALNDLLADLPPRRFAALLLAALDVTAEGGVAA